MNRYRCKECEEVVPYDRILMAPSPFDARETLNGCPVCWSVNSFQRVCDADGCDQVAECRVNTTSDYQYLCAQHYRKEADSGPTTARKTGQ